MKEFQKVNNEKYLDIKRSKTDLLNKVRKEANSNIMYRCITYYCDMGRKNPSESIGIRNTL